MYRRHESSSDEDKYVSLGKVVGVHGVHGMLKVHVFTDFPERFEKGQTLFIKEKPYTIESSFWHKQQVRIKLSGIDTIEMAESLRSEYLQVLSDQRPLLEEDSYYVLDLVGLDVFDHGEHLGVIDAVIAAPAHDLLKVGPILIPAVKAFVKKVDMQQKRVEVELIPGMREA